MSQNGGSRFRTFARQNYLAQIAEYDDLYRRTLFLINDSRLSVDLVEDFDDLMKFSKRE